MVDFIPHKLIHHQCLARKIESDLFFEECEASRGECMHTDMYRPCTPAEGNTAAMNPGKHRYRMMLQN